MGKYPHMERPELEHYVPMLKSALISL